VAGMHAGIKANGTNVGRKMCTCKWQECMYDEPPRRHAQVKETRKQHRGSKFQEQIKKHISAFLGPRANCKKEQNNCSIVFNALFDVIHVTEECYK
jgi:hypothetical protein